MEIIVGKNRIKNFFYSNKFTNTIENIGSVGKLSKEQLDLVRHALALLLLGKLNPEGLVKEIRNNCQLDDQKYTIALTIIQQKLLDPLKESLDTVYNNSVPQNAATPQNPSIIQKPVPTVYSTPQNLNVSRPTPSQSIKSVENIDPLDMFDRAKSDVIGVQQEEIRAIPERQEPIGLSIATTPVETPDVINQNIKEPVSINNNPIKINRAAILNDEENNSSLLFQDNQSVAQLSKFTQTAVPVVEKEDLNLYVPSTEIKEEPPKPLNPISPDINPNTIDNDDEAEEVETPLETVSASTPKIISLVDAQTVKPKETTIGENMSQSHLKFAQTSREEIPGNKSYSKLLNAMSPKIKNQPPIMGVLRNTFANPEKYTEPQEQLKPKPRKYTALGDNLRSSSIISSSEKSSNKESNAIMGKEIDNDIINLAKNISQEENTSVTNVSNKSSGPIVYRKPKPKEEDPFSHINTDKLSTKEKPQNSNVIDLS
jgi:hypothetical protein